jgi:proteasome accessory factor C
MSEVYGRLGNRLRRILVLVPHIIKHPGVTVEEVARRFGTTAAEVVDDLNMVMMCGLPGYTPLELIEVVIGEDGSIEVGMADYFAASLRLSPAEALALLATGAALMSLPEFADADALRRGLDKLEQALGVDADEGEGVQVEVEHAPVAHLERLRDALERHRRVHLEYLSASSGRLSERDVDPWALIAALGRWYLVGFDHSSEEERMFRTDRVKSVEVLETEAPVPADFDPGRYRGAFSGAGGKVVTMELSPRVMGWFSEYYPLEDADELADGWHRIRLLSGGDRWAAALALRLGPDVRNLGPPSVGREAVRLAAAIASRHRP